MSSTTTRSRDEVKRSLESALRNEFPNDTVDVSDGYQENIHVLVVSRQFDGLSHEHRQDLIWNVIDSTNLNDHEKQLISLTIAFSPSDLK